MKYPRDIAFCKNVVVTLFPKVQCTGGGLLGPLDAHMKTASSPSVTFRLVGDTIIVIGVAEKNIQNSYK